MRPFEFLEPQTLDEALSLLAEYKEEAKLIAGGQSLLTLLKQRFVAPTYLINIKGLSELDYIREDGGSLKIGALTTERAIETSHVVAKRFPILVDMENVLTAVQIRNWGTIGGSLAFSDPNGDPAPALIALGASVKAASTRGERTVPVEEFETGYMENVLEPDEMLTEISIPYPPAKSAGAYIKLFIRAGDIGIANVAAQVTLNGSNEVKDARVVLGAQSVSPFRAKEAEKAAIGKKAGDSFEEAGEAAAREAKPQSDVLGSAEYKKEQAKVLTKRALSLAVSRAQAA